MIRPHLVAAFLAWIGLGSRSLNTLASLLSQFVETLERVAQLGVIGVTVRIVFGSDLCGKFDSSMTCSVPTPAAINTGVASRAMTVGSFGNKVARH